MNSAEITSLPSNEDIGLENLPATYAEYKALISAQLEKQYQSLIKIYQGITQEPEFQTLLNTSPSPADNMKRFDTTYEKAGKMLESFALAVELLGSALLPEASLKMKYRAMVTHKGNKGLRDQMLSHERKIQANVQILYQQAKEIALKYNIPMEIIDELLEKEDYISMDKLITKAKKCKHGLRYNPGTGQIKCIRKREVHKQRPSDAPVSVHQTCFQRRKNDCINTEYCAWEVGKRCKSKAKIVKDNNKVTTYQNPLYNKSVPALRYPAPSYQNVMNNPLFKRAPVSASS